MSNLKFQALFIDDEPDVRSSLQGAAARKDIILKISSNLDDGLVELQSNLDIKFVILDAKGFIKSDQVKGTENNHFALEAHRKIEQLAGQQSRYLPYCFYTGHSDLKAFWSGSDDFVVFDKTEEDSVEKLFKHVRNTVENSKEGLLRQLFPLPFQAIDLIGHSTMKSDLIELLSNLEKPEFGLVSSERTSICTTVRRIQEAIYKSINTRNNSVILDSHFNQGNGMVIFGKVNKHLSGNCIFPDKVPIPTTTVFQNQYIGNLANTIYWGCGGYIHHDPHESYYPSASGIKTLMFGALELLHWYKDLCSKI